MKFASCLTVLITLVAGRAAANEKVDFNYDIRPIISQKCYHCHGPDEGSREADLRLDLREEALKERDGVRAIIPGDVKESDLVLRIFSTDKDDMMPPPKHGEALTEREKELLKRWVAQGAEYQEHWAWAAPVAEAKGTIDSFIRERLGSAGLQPSPEADRHTLIRRLSLDLIGLPPTPEEVAAFGSATSADFYEQAVDRLLASPHFGEKWARMWLDLARFADSTGYGSDKFRMNVWPYRDWVISAFNRNIPFDQFTIEQLAGDLLPGATQQQIVATAFHRNTMTNIEGGTIDEEYRVAAVKDRIATTAQVWMGLTMQCAQCHTHKFDPITHTDYYSFFAIFNQTEDSDREDEDPKLGLPTPEEKTRMDALAAEIAGLERALKASSPELEAEQHEWEAGLAAPHFIGPRPELPAGIREVLALEPSERSPEQRARLAAHFRPLAQTLAKARDSLAAKRKALAAFRPVALPIMRELGAKKQRETRILNKGNYLTPGEKVGPALPASFTGAFRHEGAPDRLAVAKWLVSPANPLTARVAVNRFWSQLFGTGLVETEEDFGTQGSLPSHPELLDWLAVEFSRTWDVKQFLKLIVTSQTYRQSSKITPAHLEKDTRNRLLARYPRRRLEAETVRDQALALAGLLSRKLGGPSVYPPQPDGLWKVAFNGGQNAYPTSTGEDRYRRGLYTFWRRTMPNPSMAAFDAPSRENCTLRRLPTNTPLQAFVTLNDPAFVECAQALARRIVREGGADTPARLRWALQLVLARPADEKQSAALAQLLEAELAHFKTDPAAATKLAASDTQPLPKDADPAELAAWTVVANVLLNLDGVLMKG